MLQTLLLFSLQLAFAADPSPAQTAATETDAQGRLAVEAHLPAEVAVDGRMIGQLFVAGRLEVEVPVGTRAVAILTNGKPVLSLHAIRLGQRLVEINRVFTKVGPKESERGRREAA